MTDCSNQSHSEQSETDLLQQILRELQETNRLLGLLSGTDPSLHTCSWSSYWRAREDLQLVHDTLQLMSRCIGCGSEPLRRARTVAVSPSRTWSMTRVSSGSSLIG